MFFTVAPQLTTIAVWIAALSVLGLFIRQFVPWKKVASDHDEQLRADLIGRVERLERTLDRERRMHDAERQVDRHRLNGISACFDALLLLIEMSPERAAEHVVKIKEMRARQMAAEAKEKAIIQAAELTAVEAERGS